MHVSMVIPVHDEQGNIGRLIEEIYQTVPVDLLHEIIVVDDGSKDRSFNEVAALVARHTNLRCLRHDRRHGKSAALRTGIEAAQAPVIACLDGDGQNDPRDVTAMMERLGPPGTNATSFISGTDAIPRNSRFAKTLSGLLSKLQRKLFRIDLEGCPHGPVLFWREALLRLPYFSRQHCYLPLLFVSAGHDIALIPVKRRQRLAGRSKRANSLTFVTRALDLASLYWLLRKATPPRIVENIGPTTGRVYSFTPMKKRG